MENSWIVPLTEVNENLVELKESLRVGFTEIVRRTFGPPGNPLLFINSSGVDTIGQCVRLTDSKATGDYEVSPAVSASFDGATHGKLIDRATGADALLAITGDFVVSGSFIASAVGSTRCLFSGTTDQDRVLLDSSNRPFVEIDDVVSSFMSISYTVGTTVHFTISRIGDQITWADNLGNSQTLTTTTADLQVQNVGALSGITYFYNAAMWDLRIEDSTGVKFSNFLAQDNEVMISEVGPDVQFVGYTGSPVEESVLYGHEWSNYSDVENLISYSEPAEISDLATSIGVTVVPATGGLATFVDNVVVFEDNSETRYAYMRESGDEGLSVLEVYIEMDDGSAPVVSDNDTESGDLCLVLKGSNNPTEISITPVSETVYKVLATREAAGPTAYFGAIKYTGQSSKRFSISRYHLAGSEGTGYVRTYANPIVGKIPADSDNASLDVFGNTLTDTGTPQRNFKVYGYTGDWDGVASLSAAHLTGSEAVVKSNGTSTPTVSAGQIDFTAGWCSYLELSNGDVFVIESSVDSNQDTIYNITNGDHATLQDATLGEGGFWSIVKEGSKLVGGGYQISGDDYIPNGAQTGDLTSPAGYIKDAPILIEQLPNKGGYAADQLAINQDYYETDGTPKQVAPADITPSNNPEYYGEDRGSGEVVIYSEVQSDSADTKIERYLNI